MMESLARHWEHLGLSVILSAGHVLTRGLVSAVERESWVAARDAGSPYSEENRDAALRAMLAKVGFAALAGAKFPQMLPDVAGEYRGIGPRAGHAVRLLGPWSGCKVGAILTLSGDRSWKAGSFRIGGGRHYWRGDDSEGVNLSSGGPGSIMSLRSTVFRPTDETAPVPFWRFKGLPQAHTAIDYVRNMPLWEWQPRESDFVADGE